MTKAGRIALSLGAGLAAGIATHFAFRVLLGHGMPALPPVAYIAYFVGILPGLLFDPIQLIVEIVAFATLYNLLRPGPAANPPD
jgi:hypothetical protein